MTSERIHLERATSFVELIQRGEMIEHGFGPKGGPATVRLEICSDATEVPALLADQVRRLERKGYRAGFHHPELEAAIVARPTDPSPRLVFADWLLDRGDPRGELITRMASGVAIADHLAAFPLHLAPPWMTSLELEWHLGFVHTLSFRSEDTSLLQRLLRHPSLMVLEELRLRELQHPHVDTYRQVLKSRPPSLRRIDARGVTRLAALALEIEGFEG